MEDDKSQSEKITAEIRGDQGPVSIDDNSPLAENENGTTKREQPRNPLHGITLAAILEHLVEKFGWEELGQRININCFNSDPSIKSSLKFLRKTDWARAKVERLYLRSIRK